VRESVLDALRRVGPPDTGSEQPPRAPRGAAEESTPST